MKKSSVKILKSIKPNKLEEKKLKDIAKQAMSKIKIRYAKTELGGSVAKGTWLKKNHDIDIYVKFSASKYNNKNISGILYKHLKKKFPKVDRIHGSRDYYQIELDNYTIEIIPILNIRKVKSAKNITDISPFHVQWVKKNKRYCNEIRLAKSFCKANKIYGAESYIKGFSGYAIEILAVYYSGFYNLIKKAGKWKEKEVIDISHYYKNRKEILENLNISKTKSPLILIDPVQKERNATAGLSKEKFNNFIRLANKFLEHPSESFFIKKDITIKELKQIAEGKRLILLEAVPLEGKKDVVGAKLLKCFQQISKQFKLNDFEIIESGWEWSSNAIFYFIFSKEKLPASKKHYGPPKNSKASLKKFRDKWKSEKIRYEKNNSYIILKRDYREPKVFLKDLLRNENIKKRVKKISLIL
ncbi:MAG: CCA tRNA nucleotidyltransferase [Nanoarchaeota archaeon]|nr:CCA tRNA nucleotidyltransferase [Nanoarchaeota archaeon]